MADDTTPTTADPAYATDLMVDVRAIFTVDELPAYQEFYSYEEAMNTAAVTLGVGARFTINRVNEVRNVTPTTPPGAPVPDLVPSGAAPVEDAVPQIPQGVQEISPGVPADATIEPEPVIDLAADPTDSTDSGNQEVQDDGTAAAGEPAGTPIDSGLISLTGIPGPGDILPTPGTVDPAPEPTPEPVAEPVAAPSDSTPVVDEAPATEVTPETWPTTGDPVELIPATPAVIETPIVAPADSTPGDVAAAESVDALAVDVPADVPADVPVTDATSTDDSTVVTPPTE